MPNLFGKDEIGGIVDEVRAAGKAAGVGETQDALYAFFLERVRTNLHIVLCLSPIGELFRARCRMFPGLVNCTTIDWFVDWPDDALFEVAQKELEEENLGSDEIKDNVCKTFVTAHQSTSETSKKMLAQNKRHNYVTPTNYLEFVNGYRALLKEKRSEIGARPRSSRAACRSLTRPESRSERCSKCASTRRRSSQKRRGTARSSWWRSSRTNAWLTSKRRP